MRKLLALLFVTLLFTSCNNGEKLEMGTVTSITVASGGESLTLTWDQIPEAESYEIAFTSDGSTPDDSSSKLTVTDTTFIHENLNETKTYKYIVRGIANGYDSTYSEATIGHIPDPVFYLSGNISDSYLGEQLLVQLVEVDYNVETESVDDNSIKEIKTVIPDDNGDFEVSFVFDRSKYVGFSYIIDLDKSNDLSNNDVVTGSGSSSSYGYLFFPVLQISSFNITKDWADFDTTHIYLSN